MNKKKRLFLTVLLAGITVFLYYPSLKYYFFQDDFYTLLRSQASSVKEFLNFFVPGGEIYYRPISMRVYFWLVQRLFGLNPFMFHLLSLGIHLINSFLVWRFVGKLVKNKTIGWISAFLYATNALHFLNLYWISETGLLFGLTFYLLTSSHYLNWLERKSISFPWLLLLLFLVGVLNHEYMLTFPATMVALWVYLRKTSEQKINPKKLIVSLLPLTLLSILYSIIRLIIFPLQVSGTYALAFGRATLKAIFWYSLWSFNVLENFRDQLEVGIRLRPEFLVSFPAVTITTMAILILATLFIFGGPVALVIQASKSLKNRVLKILTFALVWVAITLSLPLLAPAHLSPIYASLAVVGLTTSIATVFWLLYPRRHLAVSILLLVWVAHSLQTLRLTEKIHWAGQEALKAEKVIAQIKSSYPEVLAGSTFVLRNDAQTRQALFEDVGLKVIYSDQTINTYYGDAFDILPQACVNKTKPETRACLRRHNIFVP